MKNLEIDLVGACFGDGAGVKGTEKAPHIFRAANIRSHFEKLGHKVLRDEDVAWSRDEAPKLRETPKLLSLNQVVSFNQAIYERNLESYRAGHFPLVIGGDHSISIGTVAAASAFLEETKGQEARLGLMWIDAHGDINTESTSPSGNIHGMSLAALLGKGADELVGIGGRKGAKISADNLVMIGLRALDSDEKVLIKNLGITAHSMKEVDWYGIGKVMDESLSYLLPKVDGLVLSFDMDVCEPNLAPAVGTPERGGLTFREVHLMMEILASRSEKLMSLEFVEYNPSLDADQKTLDVAVSFMESALGKSILA